MLGLSSDVCCRIYGQYEEVFKAKAEMQKDTKKRTDLIKLDKWYHQELPSLICSRSDKFIAHEELAKLMRWKLMRGKFRPRLQQMVEENSKESVESASKKAFKALPNLKSAIEALAVLKAVGPATASAVLAAGAPEHAPFMADESMLALPGLQPLKYTVPAYLSYAKQVAEITRTLHKQDSKFGWTPHHVELALWTLQMAKTLKLENTLSLLDDPNAMSATDNTNNIKTLSKTSNSQELKSSDVTSTKCTKRKSAECENQPKKKKSN